MTTTNRLIDLQLVLLSSAAARDNGSLIPLPANCTQDRARIGKAVAALLRRGLVEELPVADQRLAWREQAQNPVGLFITDAGRAAIGSEPKNDAKDHTDEVEAAAASAATAEKVDATSAEAATEDTADATEAAPSNSAEAPRTASKIAAVVALLEREHGATLDEMVEATGWLPHTTRAALTGLRNKGRDIAKSKRGDATCYRIETDAVA